MFELIKCVSCWISVMALELCKLGVTAAEGDGSGRRSTLCKEYTSTFTLMILYELHKNNLT